MPTHKTYYLTCSNCGKEYREIPERVAFCDSKEEIRGLAMDDGWLCITGVVSGEPVDYCPTCKEIDDHG